MDFDRAGDLSLSWFRVPRRWLKFFPHDPPVARQSEVVTDFQPLGLCLLKSHTGVMRRIHIAKLWKLIKGRTEVISLPGGWTKGSSE